MILELELRPREAQGLGLLCIRFRHTVKRLEIRSDPQARPLTYESGPLRRLQGPKQRIILGTMTTKNCILTRSFLLELDISVEKYYIVPS